MSEQRSNDIPKLAAPARRAIEAAGIKNLNDLTKFTEAEVAEMHGIGNNALDTLRQAMAGSGLSFKG